MSKSLIKKIVSAKLMSREDQISSYNQYQEYSYNYETRDYDYPEMPVNLHIFLDYYSYEDYSGTGFGYGYDTEKEMFFGFGGSHCSCYGLEGQWDPEYYTEQQLKDVVKRILENYEKEDSYYYNSDEHAAYKEVANLLGIKQ